LGRSLTAINISFIRTTHSYQRSNAINPSNKRTSANGEAFVCTTHASTRGDLEHALFALADASPRVGIQRSLAISQPKQAESINLITHLFDQHSTDWRAISIRNDWPTLLERLVFGVRKGTNWLDTDNLLSKAH